jgi:hypothetical protein
MSPVPEQTSSTRFAPFAERGRAAAATARRVQAQEVVQEVVAGRDLVKHRPDLQRRPYRPCHTRVGTESSRGASVLVGQREDPEGGLAVGAVAVQDEGAAVGRGVIQSWGVASSGLNVAKVTVESLRTSKESSARRGVHPRGSPRGRRPARRPARTAALMSRGPQALSQGLALQVDAGRCRPRTSCTSGSRGPPGPRDRRHRERNDRLVARAVDPDPTQRRARRPALASSGEWRST